jgi:spermidine/putrescine-binding protein
MEVVTIKTRALNLQFWLTALSLLLLPLALAGCGVDEDDAEADGKLLILEWSGYEATEYPQFYAPFTEKYSDNLDEVVEYSFFADDAEALAKVQSDIGADLVHPCNSWWQLYVDSGLVQPIDTARPEQLGQNPAGFCRHGPV